MFCANMERTSHPLLSLLDASKNYLKFSLTNYIDFVVENQFGQLRNQILEMIESGQIVMGNVNASTQPNTNQVNSSSQQTTSSTSNFDCNDARNYQSNNNVGISSFLNGQNDANDINVKEEYDDDDEDEGEYMSDCDECEDCVKGICQLNLVRESDNTNKAASSGSQIGLNQDEIRNLPNATVANDLIVEKGKYKIVTLELNCTELGCKTILNSLELWKQHLLTVHGQVPYKQLKNSVRHNQRGQTEHPCTECAVVCISQTSLNKHWRYYHHVGKFKCCDCEFVANLQNKVDKHRWNEHKRDSLSRVPNAPIVPIGGFDLEGSEGEYMSESEDCKDCVNGICQQNQRLILKNNASTGNDSEIGLRQGDQPIASVVCDPIITNDNQVIVDLNQSTSENEHDLSLTNELQARNVPSTSSELRSSNRQRIQTKVFAYDRTTREWNKRESNIESTSKAAKRIRHRNDDENQQEGGNADDGDFVVIRKPKQKIVILELNCIEPGCAATLNSNDMWKKHLWTFHGKMPYKQLYDNVRLNQRGQPEYHCTECASMSKRQLSIYSHWKVYHEEGKFKCTSCEFVANLRYKVSKHQRHEHN